MTIALIDMDGVLADFDKLLFEELTELGFEFNIKDVSEQNKRYLTDCMPKGQYKAVMRHVESEGWFRRLPVIEGAKEGIDEMLSAGWDVYICTKPLAANPFCASEKMAWAKEHFPELHDRVIIAPDKSLVHGDFLLDDAIKGRWLEQARHTWKPVVFERPYNGDGSKWWHLDRWSWGQPLENLWNEQLDGAS